MMMLDEFIDYLKQQIGEPYVWGGTHTKLTPENYVSVIEKKEKNTGGYKDESYAEAAIKYCRDKFDKGATVLYAYDCSGLGCYWLYAVKHLWNGRVSANTMMSRCLNVGCSELPKKGWWVFRLSGNRASHIGYMIDDKYLIEAKGRKYGVVKTEFKSKDWGCWGVPKVFGDEVSISTEDAISPSDPFFDDDKVNTNPNPKVVVLGDSVNVRVGDNADTKVLFTAHSKNGYKKKGIRKDSDEFDLLGIADTGWYKIATYKGEGYITNKEKYTKIIE